MSATVTNADGLRTAFDEFNRHSERLEASYQALSGRVELLKQQLAQEQSARHRELLENERLGNRLLRTVELLPGAVIVLDGNGLICESNSQASSLLKRPLVGMQWSDIVRRECVPGASAIGDLCLRDGRQLSLSRSSLAPEEGEILLLADISESRRMSEMLDRKERLSEIGEMTARLAHQIRTPIASALLNIARIDGSSLDLEIADRVRLRLKEVGRMVDDMLVFTAGGQGSTERFALDELMAEIVESCRFEQGRNHLVATRLADSVEVAGNRDAIRGAMLNLIENARQASNPEDPVEVGAEMVGNRVCLTVTNKGERIPTKLLPRLFEPFFTTRPQGTGLGLAVVQSVAEAHGGEVLVDSGDRGTTFAICLPHEEGNIE